jgi:acyl-CoA thioester hydrolase
MAARLPEGERISMAEPATASTTSAGISLERDIRWGDMDALGHVNNCVYFQFCEDGRIAYFEGLGLERLRTRPTDGPGMVQAGLNFRRQLKYPGTVRIETHCTAVGSKSFTLSYTIFDGADGAVSADGSSVCVWVDYAAGKAMPLPPEFVSRIVEIEQNPALAAPRA